MIIISNITTTLRPIIPAFPLVKYHEGNHWKQQQTPNFIITPTIHQSSTETILKTLKKPKTASIRNSRTHTPTLYEHFPDTNPLQKDTQSFIRCWISCSASQCNWIRENPLQTCRKFRNQHIECTALNSNHGYFSRFFPYLNPLQRDIQQFIPRRISCSTSLCNSITENRFRSCQKFPNRKIQCPYLYSNPKYFSNSFPYSVPLQRSIQLFIRWRISCSTSLCNWTRENRF